ncbi:hypothetical protein A6R68_11140 [Neotoma lepida]|uniref:Mnd1 HTH domain-containing protein n=1 Tax=Neotoma lepida TaxID=56216 RepID=A0A1A6FW08_NEOLE|nr:hypothetical protein A6R68_11140 [Neotoma lepida]
MCPAMSVKEVLQSLVDDGMVDCERIGTSNYYWAFPSKALHARKRKLEALNSQPNVDPSKYLVNVPVAKSSPYAALLGKASSDSLTLSQANKVAKEAANRWTASDLLLCDHVFP